MPGRPGAQFVVELGSAGSKRERSHLRAEVMTLLLMMSTSIAATKVHYLLSLHHRRKNISVIQMAAEKGNVVHA